MLFDSLGRLALGQITQVYGNASGNANGVSATGAAGTIVPKVSATGLSGVAATGGVGTVASSEAKGITGVAGTGSAGTIVSSVSVLVIGVAGTGAAGTDRAAIDKGVTGVAGTGTAGSIFANVQAFLTGVAGSGFAGSMLPNPASNPVGVSGTGQAGNITIAVSGGGGKKPGTESADEIERREAWDHPATRRKHRTGLEPIDKKPVAPPLPEVRSEFIPPAELIRSMGEVASIAPGIDDYQHIMPDVMSLQEEVLDAQDISDIEQILALL